MTRQGYPERFAEVVVVIVGTLLVIFGFALYGAPAQ